MLTILKLFSAIFSATFILFSWPILSRAAPGAGARQRPGNQPGESRRLRTMNLGTLGTELNPQYDVGT